MLRKIVWRPRAEARGYRHPDDDWVDATDWLLLYCNHQLLHVVVACRQGRREAKARGQECHGRGVTVHVFKIGHSTIIRAFSSTVFRAASDQADDRRLGDPRLCFGPQSRRPERRSRRWPAFKKRSRVSMGEASPTWRRRNFQGHPDPPAAPETVATRCPVVTVSQQQELMGIPASGDAQGLELALKPYTASWDGRVTDIVGTQQCDLGRALMQQIGRTSRPDA